MFGLQDQDKDREDKMMFGDQDSQADAGSSDTGNSPAPAPKDDSSSAPSTDSKDDRGSAQPSVSDDLIDIKQRALQQLQPLVGHLDQSPEEKFKTTMMLLQATDDPSHVKDAYEAAQAIEDEKARAQALLDVVNEINYFTQQKNS